MQEFAIQCRTLQVWYFEGDNGVVEEKVMRSEVVHGDMHDSAQHCETKLTVQRRWQLKLHEN
jgi:hypothetical protein